MARKRFRKKRFRKRRRTNRVTKRYVKRAINRNIETKEQTVIHSAAVAPSDTWYNAWLTGSIDQGITSHGRIGSRVDLKRIRFNFYAGINAGAVSNKLRVIIFQYRGEVDANTTATIPAITNVVSGYLTTGVDSSIKMTYFNLPQIKILYDKNIVLADGVMRERVWRKTFTAKKLNNLQWFGAGSTDFAKGHVGIYAFSDTPAAGSPPFFGYVCRMLYKDA